MDWGHFGNWAGARLYAFALTLCFSRMRVVKITTTPRNAICLRNLMFLGTCESYLWIGRERRKQLGISEFNGKKAGLV
jgi:hypothetical protein